MNLSINIPQYFEMDTIIFIYVAMHRLQNFAILAFIKHTTLAYIFRVINGLILFIYRTVEKSNAKIPVS